MSNKKSKDDLIFNLKKTAIKTIIVFMTFGIGIILLGECNIISQSEVKIIFDACKVVLYGVMMYGFYLIFKSKKIKE